jgi:hypothetical protein
VISRSEHGIETFDLVCAELLEQVREKAKRPKGR